MALVRGVYSNAYAIICNIFTAKCGYHFYISASVPFFTIRICAVIEVIICYSQIVNEPILNTFKNNFDRFYFLGLVLKI
jgi:hypothetical protein